MAKTWMLPALIISMNVFGQKIDTVRVMVHDHPMTLFISGTGSPAVVMEAGMGATHRSWMKVDSGISPITTTLTYDRAGYGYSDSCKGKRDAVTVARELKSALQKAGIKPPYVLCGWSLGGSFVRVFAGLYPEEVAGLVLVDPAPEESYARFEKEHPELLSEDSAYVNTILTGKNHGPREEMRWFDSSMNQARRSDGYYSVPVFLLIAAGGKDREQTDPLSRIWVEELEKWAKKNNHIRYEIIKNSGHNMPREQPDTIIYAIKSIVSEYQKLQLKKTVLTSGKPVSLKDGIQVGRLDQSGLDPAIIRSLTDSIASGVYPKIHSVLILRNNKLVYENYFPGYDQVRGRPFSGFVDHHRDSLHDLRSVTKSVVSMGIMMALAQKKIKSINERVFDFFPEYAYLDTGLKSTLTIQHLLNMTSGFEWDESIAFSDSLNSERRMNYARDAKLFILSRNIVDTPGRKFNYSGGCTELLASIIEKATGLPVDKYVERNLFQPLGIKKFSWVKLRDGHPSGASGLRLRSRDMAKLGLLIANKGKWQGKQIIPQNYLSTVFDPQVSTSFSFPGVPHVAYSNQFWHETQVNQGDTIKIVQAQGNGGQLIILDSLNKIILVTTAGNYNSKDLQKTAFDLYPDFVYRAMRIQKNKKGKNKLP